MRFLVIYDVDGWSMHRQAQGVAKWHGTDHHVETISLAALSERGKRDRRNNYDPGFLKWVDSWDAVCHMSWYGSWGYRGGFSSDTGRPRVKFRKNIALVTSDGFLYEQTRNPFKIVKDWRLLVQTANRNAAKAREMLPMYECLLAANKRYEAALNSQGYKTFYAPGGVDHEEFFPKRPVSTDVPLRIGWCGHVNDDDYPNVKGYELLLQPLMERFGIKDEVEFVVNTAGHTSDNRIAPEAMCDWYNSIDVLLVTSICEGTPCPAQEAMACGRPVIGTDVGILPELIRNLETGDFIGSYRDEMSKRKAMLCAVTLIGRYMDNREHVAEMGAKARAEIEARWTWEKRAGDYIEALEWAASHG